MNNIRKHNKIIGWSMFVIYLIGLIYLLFFAESMGRTMDSDANRHYNLELFKEIKRFYMYRGTLGVEAFFVNVFGNVVAFIPFGFLKSILVFKDRNFKKTVVSGFFFSLSIEITQLILNVGSFDVDDLFLNTIGIMIGYWIFWGLKNIRDKAI